MNDANKKVDICNKQESPISDEFSQKDKIIKHKPKTTHLKNSQEAEPSKEGGSKLLSYVETYRQMIEKLNNYDKIIQRSGSLGKTLDMSGNGNLKRKRTYTMRAKGEGELTGGHPKHIQEYGQFINCLKRLHEQDALRIFTHDR